MNKLEYKYKTLSPFKLCVIENFPFIEADFDAITNYQLLCKVVEYLNKTIDNQNVLTENIVALNNWFNNLDVQDEINNKLDKMVQDGTLNEIIVQYLQIKGILGFDNKNSMKSATNLIDGSICKTLGQSEYYDGLGNFYKIRELLNTDVIDNENIIALTNYPNLVAELIPNSIMEDYKTYNSNFLLNIPNDGSDVTELLQDAINERKEIFLRDGRYGISDTLTGDMQIIGESRNAVLVGLGDTKVKVIDLSNSTNAYLSNFTVENAYVNYYKYDNGESIESSISNDRNIMCENVWINEPLSGQGRTFHKLYIKTPKPTDYTRYGHDGYACYPLEITNNSGYNALMINNICTDENGTAQSVSDNSAIGIIDKVSSSAPCILIDEKGQRHILGFSNSQAPFKSSKYQNRVFDVNHNGDIAIGCSCDYDDSACQGSAKVKINAERPNILLNSTFNETNQNLILTYQPEILRFSFGGYESAGISRAGLIPRKLTTDSLPNLSNWQTPDLLIGAMVFNITINKPVFWDGSAWRDATGTVIKSY